MYYEDNESYFGFPYKVIEITDVFGKENENEGFSLPQEDVNENQVYDRGKKP